jgi:uncharacterized protein
MRKLLIAFAVLALIIAGGWFAATRYALIREEAAFFGPKGLGAERPSDVGLNYSALDISSGDRTLSAWLVRPADSLTPSAGVLIFHGNGTSISEQVGLQQVLALHGMASMVFDYSGYGASTGTPTIAHLRQDAQAAFQTFSDSMGFTSRKYLLATSLGAAVMFRVIDDIQASVDGVVAVGTFASGVEMAVRRGRVPRWIAFAIPDPYDNVAGAARLEKPLLVVHSPQDETFPIEDAERIVAAAGDGARLVRATSASHDTYLATDADWEPVLAFLRGERPPVSPP